MREKSKKGLFKFLALFGALFLVLFGGIKNFLRTAKFAFKRDK